MGVFLRAYNRVGTPLGVMPDLTDLSVQLVDNEPGTLRFTYLRDGVNSSWLDQDELFLAVVEDGVEIPDRFILEDDTDDPVSSLTKRRLMTVSARGYMAVLEQALVYPKGTNAAQSNLYGLKPDFAMNDMTPGAIAASFIGAAKGRGCFPELVVGFTTTHDSAGRAWPKKFDATYQVGTNLLQVLTSMITDGWVDARMVGTTLRLYVPDTFFGDKDEIVRYGQNVLSAPRRRSRRDIFSHVLAAGDVEKNATVQAVNSHTQTRFGRREGYAADSKLTTTGALSSLANRELALHQQQREGFTLEMAMNAPGPGDEPWPRPGIDFTVGDRIYYDRARHNATQPQQLQVRSITKSWGDTRSAPKCTLELADLFVKVSTSVAAKVSATTGGAVGARPPVIRPLTRDKVAPGQISAITVTGHSEVVDEGTRRTWRAWAEASWPDVDQDADGTDLDDFNAYEVCTQINGGEWSGMNLARELPVVIDGLKPGDTVRVRALAKDMSGNRAPWTYSPIVTMPVDTTPPAKPSVPVMTQNMGVVTARWDGNFQGGVNTPADFHHVEVQRSLDLSFSTGVIVVDRIFEPDGTVHVTGLPYGQPWWFRLVALDVAGNRSAPSDAASIATAPLVSGDLAQDVIDSIDAAFQRAVDAQTAAQDYADTNFGAIKTTVNSWAIVEGGITKIAGGLIQTDSIAANQIKAGAIGAKLLAVADTANMVEVNETHAAVVAQTSGVHQIVAGPWSERTVNTPGEFRLSNRAGPVPFRTGQRVQLRMRAYVTSGTATATPRIVAFDESGASTTITLPNINLTTTPTDVSSEVDVTADSTSWVTYYWTLDGLANRPVRIRAARAFVMNAGELLVDGAVKTNHMEANSVRAHHMDVGSVNAVHLAFGVRGTNLVFDPSFEDTSYSFSHTQESPPGNQPDPGKWSGGRPAGSDATIVREIGAYRSGSYSAKFTSTSGGAASWGWLTSNNFKVEPGESYKVSLHATTGASGQAVPISVQAIFGVDTDPYNPISTVVLAGSTQTHQGTIRGFDNLYSDEVTAPAGVQWGAIRIVSQTGTGTGTLTLYIDDVSVVRTSTGGASEYTAAGMRLFDESGDESAAFVANRPNYLTISRDNLVVAAINSDGVADFRRVGAVEDMSIGGTPVFARATGAFSNRSFNDNWDGTRNYDAEPVGLVEASSAGVVGYVYFTPTGTTLTTSGAYYMMGQVNADLEPGRFYSVRTSPLLVSAATGVVAGLLLKYTVNGTDPNTNSAVLARDYLIGRGGFSSLQISDRPVGSSVSIRDLRVMAELRHVGYSGASSGTLAAWTGEHFFMTIYDEGYGFPPDSGTVLNQVVQAGAQAPAPVVTKRTFVSAWVANGSQTRRGAGASYGQYTINPTSSTGSTKMLAGYYSGSNGNQWSYIEFAAANSTGSETGRTISQAISGATIKKVELYVKNSSFFAGSGGQQRFGMTTISAIPGGAVTPPTVTFTGNQSFTPGQGRWITLPTAAHTAIKTNGGRVAVIGPGSSNSQSYYSGWANHAAPTGRPALRITYEK